MILFRRAIAADLDAIYTLAIQSGSGLTTFPKDKDLLHARLAWSCRSFDTIPDTPTNQSQCGYYLFVLEDTKSQQIVGIAAIEASIGYDSPFYSYHLSTRTRFCQSLNIRSNYQVLTLVNDKQGSSEICTLFLEPAYRKNGNGLLLSRARFLFMADHPNRFAPSVIAEIRGVSDETGYSPFWDHVGKYFFRMSFTEADRLTLATNKQFIADLIPEYPIYVTLLPSKAQTVIGKPHPSSIPAMTILLREGFSNHGYLDIFDAGPIIEAPFTEISTLVNSQIFSVSNIRTKVASRQFLLANTRLNYRAIIGQALYDEKNITGCIISKKVAELLEVNKDDFIRLVPLKKDNL